MWVVRNAVVEWSQGWLQMSIRSTMVPSRYTDFTTGDTHQRHWLDASDGTTKFKLVTTSVNLDLAFHLDVAQQAVPVALPGRESSRTGRGGVDRLPARHLHARPPTPTSSDPKSTAPLFLYVFLRSPSPEDPFDQHRFPVDHVGETEAISPRQHPTYVHTRAFTFTALCH
jgi:hypothetical protein